MTGFKKDPLRQTSDEERQIIEDQERWYKQQDLLGKVGTGVTPSPEAMIGESVPPARITRPNVTTNLGLAQEYAQTRTQQFAEFGRTVEPRVYYQDVGTQLLEGMKTRMPEQYRMSAAPTQLWSEDVPGPSEGMSRMFKGIAWDPATGAQAARAMPTAAPPARIPAPDEMLAERLRGLEPAAPAAGQVSWQEGVTRGMSSIRNLSGLADVDPMLGRLRVTRGEGGISSARYESATQPGVLNVPTGAITDIQSRLGGAFAQATQRFGRMDPTARAVNVQQAMYGEMQAMKQEAEKEARGLERGGKAGQAQTVRELSAQGQLIAKRIVNGALSGISEGVSRQGVSNLAFNPVGGRGNLETLMAMATGQGVSPQAQVQIGQQITQMGGFGAIGAGGGTVTYPTGGGAEASYTVPPGGGVAAGGGGRGGRGGLWEGQLGGIMYGAYIAKRFWSYTGAPVMRAMEEYAESQAALQPMLTGEIPTEGAGALTAARARGQYALGEGAYRLFGGVAEASAGVLRNPYAATMAAGAGVFGGLALGAKILGTVGAKAGIAGAAGLAGAAPVIGAAGIAYTGISLGLQAGQGIYRGQGRDLTLGETAGQTIQSIARLGAGVGIYAGAIRAGITGGQARYAEGLGQVMGGPVGDYLNQQIGTTIPGSDLGATSEQMAAVATRLGISQPEVTPLLAGAMSLTGQRGLGDDNQRIITATAQLMKTRGVSEQGALGMMGEYTSALGYLPGQAGIGPAAAAYGDRDKSLLEQSQLMRAAQTRAGQAGQFRQVISRDAIGEVPLRSMMGGFATQQIGQIAFGGVSGLISGGMGQQQAMMMGWQGGMAVSTGQMTQNQFQGGMGLATMMGDYMGPSVVRTGRMMQAFGDMSQGQMDLAGRIAGGDFGAMSFAANTGALPGFEGMALTDLAGAPTYMGNLQQGMRNLNQVSGQMGMGPGGQYAGAPGMDNLSQFMQVLQGTGSMGEALGSIGVGDAMSSFFEQNPEAGLTDYQREFSNQQFGRQMAGIGIGFQRIQMQRQFQYGGGDWRNPSAGSLWGIQDRMRSLQWQGQQAGAAFSLERMDVGNQFGIRQEELSGRRMGMQQDYQRWGMGFQRAGMDLSRQFTMENRQFQDQLRGMSTAFTMEDFEENIRMSSGRQRRQLVTQRERFVSMTGVQDEQTERGREQQEEMWAREDEQFEKRREYMEQTMALDEEQFNMNIERRETLFEMDRGDLERRIELAESLHELQDEQMEKQREYAVAQMDLAEQALGIQAASAVAQKDYNDSMLALYEDTLKPTEAVIAEIAANDPIPMLKAVEEMAKAMNAMGVEEAEALRDLVNTVGGISPSGISALNRELQTMMAIAGYGRH